MSIIKIVSIKEHREKRNHTRTVVVQSDNMQADAPAERTLLTTFAGLEWNNSGQAAWVTETVDLEDDGNTVNCNRQRQGVADGRQGVITVVCRYLAELYENGDNSAPVDPYEDKVTSGTQSASRQASKYLFPPKTATGDAPPTLTDEMREEQPVTWNTPRVQKVFSTVIKSTTDPADDFYGLVSRINSDSTAFLPGKWQWRFESVESERISANRWWVTRTFLRAGFSPNGDPCVWWPAGQTKPPAGYSFESYNKATADVIDPTL